MRQSNGDIVWGVLNTFVKDGLLTKCTQANGQPGRELTDEAFSRRDLEGVEVPDRGGDKRIIEAYRVKQRGLCPCCLAVLPERPDIDHSRARAHGGPDSVKNKQLLCPNCIRRNGAKPFEKFVADFLRTAVSRQTMSRNG